MIEDIRTDAIIHDKGNAFVFPVLVIRIQLLFDAHQQFPDMMCVGGFGKCGPHGHYIIMDGNIFGDREIIVVDLFERLVINGQARCQCNRSGIVVVDLVLKNFHVGTGEDDHAAAGGGIAYAPIGSKASCLCKIFDVVIVDIIVIGLCEPASFRQPWQVKYQETGRVSREFVVVYLGVRGVFNFTTGHIAGGFTISHHRTVRLSHIDAGIGRAFRKTAVDQYLAAEHGIDGITAAGGICFLPDGMQVTDHHVLALVYLEQIALGVADGHVFDGEKFGIGNTDSFTTLALHGKIKDGLIGPVAPQLNMLQLREAKVVEFIQALFQVYLGTVFQCKKRFRDLAFLPGPEFKAGFEFRSFLRGLVTSCRNKRTQNGQGSEVG